MVVVYFFLNLILIICGLFSKNVSSDLDDNLGSFWKSLRGIEQKIWYANEVYTRTNLNVQTISDEAIEKLRTKKRNLQKPTFIIGTHNYEILSNFNY